MGGPKYLWLDLETTGLDSGQCTILEVAASITDFELVVIDTFEAVVHHDRQTLIDRRSGLGSNTPPAGCSMRWRSRPSLFGRLIKRCAYA